jgi:hypothetical protein
LERNNIPWVEPIYLTDLQIGVQKSLYSKEGDIKTMTRESQSKMYSFFSVATLLLLTLIIGNLIHNIQYLDIPPETRLPYPEIGGGEAAVFDVSDNGEGMRWVLVTVLALLFGIAIAGLVI